MRRRLAAPALHFLVLGAFLWAGDRWLSARVPYALPASAAIEIGAERIEALRAGWVSQTGGPPDARILSALVDREIDEEVLLAEARARGYEALDPVVRARLARNVAFLAVGPDGVRAGGAAQVEEALALGLARGDLVVRRRLVERMRAELGAGQETAPSEAEIAARYARDPSRFRSPARVRLSHIYLSRDRRGAAITADAARLRERIVGASLDGASAVALGDPFLLGHRTPLRSGSDLARDFGPAFAKAALALEPGLVSEPVASSYGLHLIIVHERRPEAPATLDGVRAEIAAELVRERDAFALRAALDGLRGLHEIRIVRAGR